MTAVWNTNVQVDEQTGIDGQIGEIYTPADDQIETLKQAVIEIDEWLIFTNQVTSQQTKGQTKKGKGQDRWTLEHQIRTMTIARLNDSL